MVHIWEIGLIEEASPVHQNPRVVDPGSALIKYNKMGMQNSQGETISCTI